MHNKKIMKRFYHGAAPFTISPDCIEVVLFGGLQEFGGSSISDTAVLRFGKVLYRTQARLQNIIRLITKPNYDCDYTMTKLIQATLG